VNDRCRIPCGALAGEIDLKVPGAADGQAIPAPFTIRAVGTRAFVTLENVEEAEVTCDGFTFTWFLRPAGNGKLAVIDTGNADAVSFLDLGAGCKAPTGLAVDGSRLWVSCGSRCFPDLAPGAFVPVDVSGAAPIVGTATSIAPVVGGSAAVCRGRGYVADQQKTGLVVPFDPSSGAAAEGVAVCPFDLYGNSLASGFACTE
jgi:hypothetical protein